MEFPLTFAEAMKVLEKGIYNETCVQGEGFREGLVLREGLLGIEAYDTLQCKTINFSLNFNLMNQYYRVVNKQEKQNET